MASELEMQEAEDTIDRLRQRIEELERALEPFAREADDWPPETPDSTIAGDYDNITVGHLRRARAARNRRAS